MAFMIPEYTNEPFFAGETKHGEGVVCPVDVYRDEHRFASECDVGLDTVERIDGRWWARLSAPGYCDATDWGGPFDTQAEAREYIESTYEVNADTGDELSDEDTRPERG